MNFKKIFRTAGIFLVMGIIFGIIIVPRWAAYNPKNPAPFFEFVGKIGLIWASVGAALGVIRQTKIWQTPQTPA